MKRFFQIIFLINIFFLACSIETKKENSLPEIKIGGYLIVTAKGGLNLRVEPSRKGKVVKLISEFFPVQVLEIVSTPDTIDNVTSNWYKVKSGKEIGYCFGAYLTPYENWQGKITDSQNYLNITSNDSSYINPFPFPIHILEKPDYKAKSIGQIPSKEKFIVTRDKVESFKIGSNRYKWIEISYGDKKGFYLVPPIKVQQVLLDTKSIDTSSLKYSQIANDIYLEPDSNHSFPIGLNEEVIVPTHNKHLLYDSIGNTDSKRLVYDSVEKFSFTPIHVLVVAKGIIGWRYFSEFFPKQLKDKKSIPKKITSSDVIGTWQISKKSEQHITIFKDGTYSGSLSGGCETEGCIILNIGGKWKIINEFLYFYDSSRADNKDSDTKTEPHIYWIDEDSFLQTDGTRNGFKENYQSDLVTGWRKW